MKRDKLETTKAIEMEVRIRQKYITIRHIDSFNDRTPKIRGLETDRRLYNNGRRFRYPAIGNRENNWTEDRQVNGEAEHRGLEWRSAR